MIGLLSLWLRSTNAVRALSIGTLLALSQAPMAYANHMPIEGYGAPATGGATECVVSNTNASGSGSLRSCLSGGNKLIKFSTSGTITITNDTPLVVESNTTIDGFTAPSPGIDITGGTLRFWDVTNVIVRNLRMRNVGFSGTTPSTSYGTVTQEIDCIDIQGTSSFLVFDHVSVWNCGDGGLDVKAPASDVTVQWSIFSTWKTHLFGITTTNDGQPNPGRVSYHHNAIVCNDQGNLTPAGESRGCDRNPLIRAAQTSPIIDIRYNNIQGPIGSNATEIECCALVNVVGNAYVPQPLATLNARQNQIEPDAGAQVYTSGNTEYPASAQLPAVSLNGIGNLGSAHSTPSITAGEIGCAKVNAGAWPRDSVDTTLLGYLADVPSTCTLASMAGATTKTVSLATSGAGTGTVGGAGSYIVGSTVTLTATPGAGSTSGGWSPSPCAASFTMPNNNLTCTHAFNLSGGASVNVTYSPSTPNHGDTITVTVTGGPGNAKDWVAISPSGSSLSTYHSGWKYVNNTQTSTTGASNFSVTLTVPPSSYCTSCLVRFYVNDTFNLVSGHTPVALTPASPAPGASTFTGLVQSVRLAVTIGSNRPAVQSITWKANGTTFATGTALNATWNRPSGNTASVPTFSATITYVGGTTEVKDPITVTFP